MTVDIDDLAGQVIAGRYVIEECIGHGGMGRVYRARHKLVSRRFAVKLLFGNVAADEKARARFTQEAEAASRLAHPNLVSMVDFGEWEGRLFLVMDHVEGPSLADIIQQEAPLAPERVAGLARQLAAGLQHAHERNLIHRDFKPANILVEREGAEERARILDFGLAILPEATNHRLTTDGLILGTPAFMSPEQACGEAIDHRSDLFALGLIMYEMLAGKHPFDGTPAAIARQNLAAKPPRIRKRAPEARVPADLEAVVFRLLAKEPADRFQSAAEVIAALDRLVSILSPSASRHITISDVHRPRRWRVALVALLLIGLAGGGALWWQRDRAESAGAGSDVSGAGADPAASGTARTGAARAPGEPGTPSPAQDPASEPGPAGVAGAELPAAGRADAELPDPTQIASVAAAPGQAQDPAPGATARPDKPGRARRKPLRRAGKPQRARPAAQSDAVSIDAFRARYRAVGAQVDRLERTRGSAAARPLRERYLAIPYLDALRLAPLRQDAHRRLGALARDLRRALGARR